MLRRSGRRHRRSGSQVRRAFQWSRNVCHCSRAVRGPRACARGSDRRLLRSFVGRVRRPDTYVIGVLRSEVSRCGCLIRAPSASAGCLDVPVARAPGSDCTAKRPYTYAEGMGTRTIFLFFLRRLSPAGVSTFRGMVRASYVSDAVRPKVPVLPRAAAAVRSAKRPRCPRRPPRRAGTS